MYRTYAHLVCSHLVHLLVLLFLLIQHLLMLLNPTGESLSATSTSSAFGFVVYSSGSCA